MSDLSISTLAVTILYSDNDIIVIEKPAGLLSVPGPAAKDCAQTQVQQLFPTVRLVHRLDCATSGLMIFALNLAAQQNLSRQFHDRIVKKQYVACVQGDLQQAEGEVDLPLMKDWPNRPRQMVSPEGKPALTHYRRLAHSPASSRVLLLPVTGRSHQLRVHMLSIGHCILGDDLYGDEANRAASDRLLLHASYLGVQHPVSQQFLEFESAAPF
jgi:tRNA pseudouridine32 synthase / 23S rRNA pseudouridine746 synthase